MPLSILGTSVCPGSTHRFRDWKAGGHGVVDLHKSLVVSCDTYYYGLANDLGIDNIFNFTGQFGLGKKTGNRYRRRSRWSAAIPGLENETV